MSYVDVAIPALIGIVLLMWPQVMFAGSKVTPDVAKLRAMRIAGLLLLVAAAVYLAVRLAGV